MLEHYRTMGYLPISSSVRHYQSPLPDQTNCSIAGRPPYESCRSPIPDLKIALSSVCLEGAKAALAKENPGWDFDKIRMEACRQWNNLFDRVKVTGRDEQKKNFYTSLYHLFIQPKTWRTRTDVIGVLTIKCIPRRRALIIPRFLFGTPIVQLIP